MKSVPHHSYNPQDFHPQLFRHEVGDLAKKHALVPYIVDLYSPRDYLEVVRQRARPGDAGPRRLKLRVIYGGRRYSFSWRAKSRRHRYVADFKVSGFETNREYFFNGEKAKMLHPRNAREMERILSTAAELMEAVRKWQARLRGGDPKAALPLLTATGYYYFLMIYCMPFCRQNNSLIMNQVNTILYFNFGKCIEHATLDFLAYILPSDLFVRAFLSEVRSARSMRKAPLLMKT